KNYNKLSKTKKDNINKYALIGKTLFNESKKANAKKYYYYYYATQELVWDQITSSKYRFKTNLTTYRNNISNIFKNFDIKTTLNNKTYTLTNNQSITLKDSNLKDFSITNKADFEKKTGLIVKQSGNNLTISNPKNNNKVIKQQLKFDKYKNKYPTGSSVAYTNATHQDFVDAKLENKIVLNININTRIAKGGFKGVKVSEDNKPVKGVVFNYYKDNILQGELISDINGKFEVNNLDVGEYKVKEIKTRDDLILNPKEYQVIVKDGIIETLNDNKPIINKYRTGGFELIKKDEENNKLSGIEFNLYDQNNNFIEKLTSNKEGAIKKDKLIVGKYYLKEVKTNANLMLDSKTILIDVKDNSIIKLGDIINKFKRHKLTILKYDKKTNKRILGATFALYDNTNNFIQNYVDNDSSISGLKQDGYYIKEIKAPVGYQLDNIMQKVYLDNDKEIKFYNEKNIKPTLVIEKVDKNNGEPLSNTYFSIGDGINNKYYKTDEKGLIEVILDNKCYKLNETKAKVGYINNNKTRNICLKGSVIKKVRIENEKINDYKVGLDDKNKKSTVTVILLGSLICTLVYFIKQKIRT
ncbi:MAG: SpaA isopeptide-forming pilin-related protein, partial [Erysipelotrichales bacterium]